MYDTACFLTDDKFYLKYKKWIIVQGAVEKPYLYILARSPSNDQQILCSKKIISDILKIGEPLQNYNGFEIYDDLRSFKVDSSARQFEAGHQKREN